jgi:uncharacterized protein YlxW (UPF0749 family)
VPVVLVGIGLLLVASATLANESDVRADRRTDLVDLIRAQQSRVDSESHTISALRESIDAASVGHSTSHVSPSLEQMVSPVEGPGIAVELRDAPIPASGVAEGYVADDYLVHEQDVLGVLNALWTGGARAVAVMDQRIVSTSAVRCVGNTLLLHGRVYAPPYTVTAVGPPDRMQRALAASPRVTVYRQYVDLLGLGYRVDERGSVQVPAYEGPITAQYAEVSE